MEILELTTGQHPKADECVADDAPTYSEPEPIACAAAGCIGRGDPAPYHFPTSTIFASVHIDEDEAERLVGDLDDTRLFRPKELAIRPHFGVGPQTAALFMASLNGRYTVTQWAARDLADAQFAELVMGECIHQHAYAWGRSLGDVTVACEWDFEGTPPQLHGASPYRWHSAFRPGRLTPRLVGPVAYGPRNSSARLRAARLVAMIGFHLFAMGGRISEALIAREIGPNEPFLATCPDFAPELEKVKSAHLWSLVEASGMRAYAETSMAAGYA